MINLETDDHQRLVNLLKDLPEMAAEASRQAILEYAGLKKLLSMIDLSGTPFIAANNIVSDLSKRGCLTYGHEALGLLLNSIKILVGVDEKKILDGLLIKYNMIKYNMFARLPRIFVSHNTKGTEDENLLDNICNRLNKDFEVITDNKKQGIKNEWQHWHLKLLNELGKCDAGIIFLNDQNCTDLDCVHTASILRWRYWKENYFKLLIICLGTVTSKHTCEGAWARLSFSGTHQFFFPAPKEDEILKKINSQLNYLRTYPCKKTPVERMEDALTGLLAEVKDKNYLKDAVNEIVWHSNKSVLPIEHGCYNQSQLPVEQCLARAMLRQGMGSFYALINTLKNRITNVSYRNILELIAPSWVDLRAAGLIAKNINKKHDERVFCVNGGIPNFTGEMYVRQACYSDGGPDYSWKVIQVTTIDGDNVIEFIIRQIRKGLINKFPSIKKRYSRIEEIDDELIKKIDKMINQQLEEQEANNDLTFVVVPPAFEINTEVLKQIRNSYPSLTFFLLTGCKTTHPSFDHVEFLEPFLNPGAEDRANQEYDYNSNLIPSD